jgi:ABC-type thiamine transport system ATPase subunit
VRAELAALFATLSIPVLIVTHDDDDRAAFDAPTLHVAEGRVVEPAA